MRFITGTIFSCLLLGGIVNSRAHGDGGQDVVDSYLEGLTLEQKINQMAQIDIGMIDMNDKSGLEYYFGKAGFGSIIVEGSLFDAKYVAELMAAVQNVTETFGMPPVLAGIDSVHGANYIKGATIFPQQINLAATFDTEHARYVGKIAARDSLAAGSQWLYAPVLGIGMNPLWSRFYETFGEDPHLVGAMASAMIQGIQEDGKSAACAKHFVGYSLPRDGHDRSPAWIPTRHLYQYFVRPWRDAMKTAEPLTVMESYAEYDGVPNVANRHSLNMLLRKDLGFNGILVSDYHEVGNLVGFHRTAEDMDEAVSLALFEGSIDIYMLPFGPWEWEGGAYASLSEDKERATARIDQSVTRILKVKQKLGMFDKGYGKVNKNRLMYLEKGDADSRKKALQMARDSIVLAKNNPPKPKPISDTTSPTVDAVNHAPVVVAGDTLPISLNKTESGNKIKVHVMGPGADSLAFQSGGWTLHWGGANDNEFVYGTTVLDAAQSIENWEVTTSSWQVKMSDKQAEGADHIIICIGEHPYAEKGGDILDPALPKSQVDLVARMRKIGSSIIVVYFGGRPRLLGSVVENADAVILAFLPGPDAGRAVVELISGKENFVGKLPFSYPKNKDLSGVPYWHAVSDQCFGGTGECQREWNFGHGLSYSAFGYSDLKSTSKELVYTLPFKEPRDKMNGSTEVSVKVKNIRGKAGTETVLFFLSAHSRHVTPEWKLLLHFAKVHLKPNEEKTVSFNLTTDMLKYVGPHDDTHDILQMNEKFRIGVGPQADCLHGLGPVPCSDEITLVLSDNSTAYNPACESACATLDEYNCLGLHHMSPKECYEKCLSDPSNVDPMIQGWGWNYVNCLEPILWDNARLSEEKCAAVNAICRNVLSPAGVSSEGTSHVLLFVGLLLAAFVSLYIVRELTWMKKEADRAKKEEERTVGEFTPLMQAKN